MYFIFILRWLLFSSQESERRVRQKESELERFKVKMEAVVVKERAVAARHRSALSAWRSGAVLSVGGTGTGTGGHNSPKASAGTGPSSPFGRSSMSAHCSPNSKMQASPALLRRMSDSPANSARQRRESISSSSTLRHQSIGDEASAWDVIEALDDQRCALERANEELMEQLADMNRSLISESSRSRRTSINMNDLSRSNLFGSADQSDHGGGGGINSIALTPLRWDQSSTSQSPSRTQPTATATKMYEHITELQKKIEQAELKSEKERIKGEEADKMSMQLRAKMQEMKEVLEK